MLAKAKNHLRNKTIKNKQLNCFIVLHCAPSAPSNLLIVLFLVFVLFNFFFLLLPHTKRWYFFLLLHLSISSSFCLWSMPVEPNAIIKHQNIGIICFIDWNRPDPLSLIAFEANCIACYVNNWIDVWWWSAHRLIYSSVMCVSMLFSTSFFFVYYYSSSRNIRSFVLSINYNGKRSLTGFHVKLC